METTVVIHHPSLIHGHGPFGEEEEEEEVAKHKHDSGQP